YVTFTGEEKKDAEVVFNKKGIRIQGKQYDWFQYDRLKLQMNRKLHKRSKYHYAPWGPLARCWCETILYSPEDECMGCVADYRVWNLLKAIPQQEIEDAKARAEEHDDDWEAERPPSVQEESESEEKGPRNGWGVLIKDDIVEEWPAYQTDTGAKIQEVNKEERPEATVILTEKQQQQLDQLLLENKSIFADGHMELTKTTVVQHFINTGDSQPVKQKLRYLPNKHF